MTSWREINERDEREGREHGHEEVGLYKLAVSKGGPDVAGAIFYPCPIEMHPEFWNVLDRGSLHAPVEWINGKRVHRYSIYDCAAVRIAADEYQYLIARSIWARKYDPDAPEAHPYRRVVHTPKAKAENPTRPEIDIRDIPIQSLMP